MFIYIPNALYTFKTAKDNNSTTYTFGTRDEARFCRNASKTMGFAVTALEKRELQAPITVY